MKLQVPINQTFHLVYLDLFSFPMPELPDVVVYLESLDRLLGGRELQKVVVKSPFVMRTFDPDISEINGKVLTSFSRIGKRIVWHFEEGLCVAIHLMIAGRFHWKKKPMLPKAKNDLAAFQFEHGTMMLTEASKKKRAAMHVVRSNELQQFQRGGIDLFSCSKADFSDMLNAENRTLKRALTSPSKFDGIGNAYSDEILLHAGLSPLKRTHQLKPDETDRLFEAAKSQLHFWTDLLRKKTGDQFPEKVTAFRPEMAAHGKFNEPCPVCETKIQRIVYVENECNYCPKCQTGGKILADRSLSRLLKDEWPRTIEELEQE